MAALMDVRSASTSGTISSTQTKKHSEECRLRFCTERQEAENPKYNLVNTCSSPIPKFATMNLAALIYMTDIDNELNQHNQNLGMNQKIGRG